jgi:hypothetical protein
LINPANQELPFDYHGQAEQETEEELRMTRKEVLTLLVLLARRNGFEFRKWYRSKIQLPWVDFESAIGELADQHRYYTLLFSHDFARCFWKQGTQMSFIVPAQEYTARGRDGKPVTVRRKAYTRRTNRPDTWLYHLREMAAAEDPLRYIRRFLITQEEIESWDKPSRNHIAGPSPGD